MLALGQSLQTNICFICLDEILRLFDASAAFVKLKEPVMIVARSITITFAWAIACFTRLYGTDVLAYYVFLTHGETGLRTLPLQWSLHMHLWRFL
jgi:hypothetical protein